MNLQIIKQSDQAGSAVWREFSSLTLRDTSLVSASYGVSPACRTEHLQTDSLPASARPARIPSVNEQLKNYISGWENGNVEIILAAVTDEYRFRDPFVGTFDRENLAGYFDILQKRLESGARRSRPFPVVLRGLPKQPAAARCYRLWRDIAEFGLSGMTEIHLAGNKVANENVSYDLNMASERLRARSAISAARS